MLIHDFFSLVISRLKPLYSEFTIPYAERIIQHYLQCSRTALYLRDSYAIEDDVFEACIQCVNRAVEGEPLDYILGASYFYNREFIVSPDVLIPRPDTEMLIETILENEKNGELIFADVGTGSGIIACILTEMREKWYAMAIDQSMNALKIFLKNKQNMRISPLCGNKMTMIAPKPVFNFIVSNPPYIQSKNIQLLDRSVRDFEPLDALDGGMDGLDFYRYFADEAPLFLKKKGALYCEIGFDQADQVKKLFSTKNWDPPEIIKDLGGNNRVLYVRKR